MIIHRTITQPYSAQWSERGFLVIATCYRNDRIIHFVEANIWEHVVTNPSNIALKKIWLEWLLFPQHPYSPKAPWNKIFLVPKAMKNWCQRINFLRPEIQALEMSQTLLALQHYTKWTLIPGFAFVTEKQTHSFNQHLPFFYLYSVYRKRENFLPYRLLLGGVNTRRPWDVRCHTHISSGFSIFQSIILRAKIPLFRAKFKRIKED